MREQGESFFEFAQRKSREHYEFFAIQPLDSERVAFFSNLAETSWQQQRAIEAADDISFDTFLANYFAQQ
jgi:glutamate--cysteine ligase